MALIYRKFKKTPYFPNSKQRTAPMPSDELENNGYYHIYNRANGREKLFRDKEDHLQFLSLYEKYILPIADTYAWVLMKNHFHFLIRVKANMYYKYTKEDIKNQVGKISHLPTDVSIPPLPSEEGYSHNYKEVKWHTFHVPENSLNFDQVKVPSFTLTESDTDYRHLKKANPTAHFSHFFASYVKFYNKKYELKGSLFKRTFQRILVKEPGHIETLVLYIHNNPIHHRFTDSIDKYPWSSYHNYISGKSSYLSAEEVLGWFNGLENFKKAHENFSNIKSQEVSSLLKKESSEDD